MPYFYITGGDPILHPDFWRLCELLKVKAIPFTLMGNPFHIAADVCAELKECGCEKYQMSLDGLRETHDWFRKPGSFDCTLEKIAAIKAAGIRAVIMSTVSGVNIKEIPTLIDVVVEHDVDVFAFARYCPTSLEKDTNITPQEYRTLLEVCDKKFQQYKDSGTYFNLKDHLWTLYQYEKGKFKIPADLDEQMIYGGCNCGNSHITILPSGDIYACRRFESKVGNMYADRLADVWVGPNMEHYRNYGAFKKCGNCELLRFCRGCPAVAYGTACGTAYGTTQGFYSADPQCWKEVGI
jgi:radical SAM/SPASM domain protein of ACGX system